MIAARWTRTGSVLAAGTLALAAAVLAAPPALTRGRPLQPGSAAATPYLDGGWGVPEGAFRWTVAPRAAIAFTLEEPGPAVVRLVLHGHVAGAVPAQRVTAALDGQLLSAWAIRDAAVRVKALAVTAPLAAGPHTFALELPDAASPQAAGTGPDTRLLGVAVHAFSVDSFPRAMVDGPPLAWASDAARSFGGTGWAEPEDGARWTEGRRAEVLFALPDPGARDLVLEMELEPFVRGTVLPEQRVRALLNDDPAGAFTAARYGRRTVSIPLPRASQGAANVLALALGDARSPASVRQSRDRRLLALRVHALRWRSGPVTPSATPR